MTTPHPSQHPLTHPVVLVQPAGEVLPVQHLLKVLPGQQLVLAGLAPGHAVETQVLQAPQAAQGGRQGAEAVAIQVQLAQLLQVPDVVRQAGQLQVLDVQALQLCQLGYHLHTGQSGVGGGGGKLLVSLTGD